MLGGEYETYWSVKGKNLYNNNKEEIREIGRHWGIQIIQGIWDAFGPHTADSREKGIKDRELFLESVCLAFKQIVEILERGKWINRREKAQSTRDSKKYDSK